MHCNSKIKNRIQRCNGQMHGVLKMMEEEKDCQQVLTQLSAVRSSIDKIMTLIAINNLTSAYEDDERNQESIEKAKALLLKTK